MILDLLPRYNKASGTDDDYVLLKLFSYDEHEVAWVKRTIIDNSGEFTSTCLVVCDCDFTEGVGWYYGSDDCFYSTPEHAKNCLYRRQSIGLRYQELRDLCAAGSKPTVEEIEQAMFLLITLASEHEMIGDEYESSYFSLQTFIEIMDISPEAARTATSQIYDTKVACFDGRDIVPYKEPLWFVRREEIDIVTKITSKEHPKALTANVTMYEPAHQNMPPKWRYDIQFSDDYEENRIIDTSKWMLPLVEFRGDDVLNAELAKQRFTTICDNLAKARTKDVPINHITHE